MSADRIDRPAAVSSGATIGNRDTPILEVRDLRVDFKTTRGPVRAVDGVDFAVRPGETVGIVGESGSGKSVTVLSIMQLLPTRSTTITGSILWEGTNLLASGNRAMRNVRGGQIAMVFQNPLSSLNPVQPVGVQITEMIREHEHGLSKAAARRKAIELLDLVGVPEPHLRVDQYPHEFSGGMQQRAVIAMAISNSPKLLIADEPTTALDVTIQAQILEVLTIASREVGASLLLITHDLGVVAELADRVLVMYDGRIRESGSVYDVFDQPLHPYTSGLLASLPDIDESPHRLPFIPGTPPDPMDRPDGCSFAPRCALSAGRTQCVDTPPDLTQIEPGHLSACFFADELLETTA